jgi:hypothetical protein
VTPSEITVKYRAIGPTCAGCRHAVVVPSGGTYARTHFEGKALECHKRAPERGVRDAHGILHAAWPRVQETDSCSEYASKGESTGVRSPLGELFTRAADLLRVEAERTLRDAKPKT